ncbi:MAG: phenylalanine--tRNA ligase subunit beta [Candidatus Paceibacteria bacterium]
MKILYSWLKDFISIKESPEKLAERLSFSSFETLVDKKLKNDAVLEISLLPNRVADAAGHLGIAREIGLLTGRVIKFKEKLPKTIPMPIAKFVKLQIQSHKLVRRYSLRGVIGVKVKESPTWLKKRLRACGLRPINNIVDLTNYVMLELGQPLHAFDLDQIADLRRSIRMREMEQSTKQSPNSQKIIIVRQARKGEKIETIERKTYELQGFEILIADPEGPLGLAGIKGGRRAEISNKTKNIVIESANFDPVAIRRASKLHNLKTDASWRFENNLDPNLTIIALDRVVSLIQEVAGGEILNGALDYYPKKEKPVPIVVSMEKTAGLLGVALTEQKFINLIKPFCRKIERRGKGKFVLHINTYRRDLRYPEDIAEEVARLIGYNNIPARPPVAPISVPSKNELYEAREILKDHLISLGFSETQNYSFISEADATRFQLSWQNLIEIENPMSREWKYLRYNLLVGLLKNVRDNLRYFKEVRLFEIGKEYSLKGQVPDERWSLCALIASKTVDTKANFFELKGALESLLERLGFDREDYRFARPPKVPVLCQIPECALYIEDHQVGTIDYVPEDILRAYDIDAKVAYFSLDISALSKELEEELE